MGFQDRFDSLTRTVPWSPELPHENRYQIQLNPYVQNLMQMPYAGAVMDGPFRDVATLALNTRMQEVHPLEEQPFRNNYGAVRMNLNGEHHFPTIEHAMPSVQGGYGNNPLSNHGERRAFGRVMNDAVTRAIGHNPPPHPAFAALRNAERTYPSNNADRARKIAGLTPDTPPFNTYRDAINRPDMSTITYSERSPCASYSRNVENDSSCLNYFGRMLPHNNNRFGYAQHFIPGDAEENGWLRNQAIAARAAAATAPDDYINLLGRGMPGDTDYIPMHPAFSNAYPHLENI